MLINVSEKHATGDYGPTSHDTKLPVGSISLCLKPNDGYIVLKILEAGTNVVYIGLKHQEWYPLQAYTPCHSFKPRTVISFTQDET